MITPTTDLPPSIDVPAVAEAADHYRKIHGEHSAAADQLRDLEERRQQAVEADRAAYASAIRAGKADPGQKAVEKLDAEMLATRRRTEALAVAVEDAEAELRAAIGTAKDEWSALLDRQAAESRDHYDSALAALEGAVEQLREVNGIASWLNRFPAERMPYKPGGPSAVRSLVSPNGAGYFVGAVLEAMRSVNEPHPSPTTPIRRLQPVGGEAA